MPKHLGINYFQRASEERISKYFSMILPEPRHLEKVPEIVFPSDKLWEKVHPTWDFIKKRDLIEKFIDFSSKIDIKDFITFPRSLSSNLSYPSINEEFQHKNKLKTFLDEYDFIDTTELQDTIFYVGTDYIPDISLPNSSIHVENDILSFHRLSRHLKPFPVSDFTLASYENSVSAEFFSTMTIPEVMKIEVNSNEVVFDNVYSRNFFQLPLPELDEQIWENSSMILNMNGNIIDNKLEDKKDCLCDNVSKNSLENFSIVKESLLETTKQFYENQTISQISKTVEDTELKYITIANEKDNKVNIEYSYPVDFVEILSSQEDYIHSSCLSEILENNFNSYSSPNLLIENNSTESFEYLSNNLNDPKENNAQNKTNANNKTDEIYMETKITINDSLFQREEISIMNKDNIDWNKNGNGQHLEANQNMNKHEQLIHKDIIPNVSTNSEYKRNIDDDDDDDDDNESNKKVKKQSSSQINENIDLNSRVVLNNQELIIDSNYQEQNSAFDDCSALSLMKFKNHQKQLDPLEMFLILRNTKKSKCKQSLESSTNFENSEDQYDENILIAVPKTQANDTKRVEKSFSKIHEISLSGDYLSALTILNEHAQPLLNSLIQSNIVSYHKNFLSLSPDITRFILNQYIKSMEDNQMLDSHDNIYCCILALHGLVKASFCLQEHSLECALISLRNFQDEHNELLEGFFDTARQQLSMMHTSFMDQHVLHPKLEIVRQEISSWLEDIDKCFIKQKILMIIRTNLDHFKFLSDSVFLNGGFKIIFVMDDDVDMIKTLETPVLVVARDNVQLNNFPWTEFSLVIDYEHYPKSLWKNLSSNHQINFIGLITILPQTEDVNMIYVSERCVSDKNTQKFTKMLSPLVLIGSSTLFDDSDLVPLLEKKSNIVVIERDYSCIQEVDKICLAFADITVDERTGIVIRSISVLDSPRSFNHLINSLLVLSLKFVYCWLILQNNPLNNETSLIQENSTKLFGAVTLFSSIFSEYFIQMLYASNTEQICDHINSIIKISCETNPVWISDEWANRPWLKLPFTEHEKFLLSFPSINSISAQLMLSSMPLRKILQSDRDELITLHPFVPQRFIEHFHHFLNLPSSTFKHSPSEIQTFDGKIASDDLRNIDYCSDTEEDSMEILNVEEGIDKHNDNSNLNVNSSNIFGIKTNTSRHLRVTTKSFEEDVAQKNCDFLHNGNMSTNYSDVFGNKIITDEDMMENKKDFEGDALQKILPFPHPFDSSSKFCSAMNLNKNFDKQSFFPKNNDNLYEKSSTYSTFSLNNRDANVPSFSRLTTDQNAVYSPSDFIMDKDFWEMKEKYIIDHSKQNMKPYSLPSFDLLSSQSQFQNIGYTDNELICDSDNVSDSMVHDKYHQMENRAVYVSPFNLHNVSKHMISEQNEVAFQSSRRSLFQTVSDVQNKTRKFLAKKKKPISYQASSSRVMIGIAQPNPRNKFGSINQTSSVPAAKEVNSDRLRTQYEAQSSKEHELLLKNSRSQKSVSTSPLRKKNRLTFIKTPGTNGQTKLLFL